MSTSRYRGFKVVARPYQLFDSKRWISDLEIRRDGRSQAFGIDDHYPNELEAEAGSARAGREIIDGRLAGISVEHMRRESRGRVSSVPAWKGMVFRPFLLAGLVLLSLGAVVLLRGDRFRAQPETLLIFDGQMTARERQTVSPWMGVVALMMGAGLIVTGIRRRGG